MQEGPEGRSRAQGCGGQRREGLEEQRKAWETGADVSRVEHWGLLTEITSWKDPSAQVSFVETAKHSRATLS